MCACERRGANQQPFLLVCDCVCLCAFLFVCGLEIYGCVQEGICCEMRNQSWCRCVPHFLSRACPPAPTPIGHGSRFFSPIRTLPFRVADYTIVKFLLDVRGPATRDSDAGCQLSGGELACFGANPRTSWGVRIMHRAPS